MPPFLKVQGGSWYITFKRRLGLPDAENFKREPAKFIAEAVGDKNFGNSSWLAFSGLLE